MSILRGGKTIKNYEAAKADFNAELNKTLAPEHRLAKDAEYPFSKWVVGLEFFTAGMHRGVANGGKNVSFKVAHTHTITGEDIDFHVSNKWLDRYIT